MLQMLHLVTVPASEQEAVSGAPGTVKGSRNHRITESLMLEKTSKIIKPNGQPITTVPTKPCPEEPHLHVF